VYRSQLEGKQREIDAEEQRLMKTVFAEVDQVVEKIANAEGYHLVFEGGSGRGGVIYYSTTIDITQKVVDALNSGK
jgi:Skp family chaperone for outer membrane proteins